MHDASGLLLFGNARGRRVPALWLGNSNLHSFYLTNQTVRDNIIMFVSNLITSMKIAITLILTTE